MVRIVPIDINGKVIGDVVECPDEKWAVMQKFGKTLRWKLAEEKKDKTNKKEEKNERKERSGTGNAVEKA